MRKRGERLQARNSELIGRPGEFGALLVDLRTAMGLSLRAVEEATGKAVSNAYLSQLEKGKIKQPSPSVLHSLAQVYVVPYEALMRKVGYLMPSDDDAERSETDGSGRRSSSTVFAIDDLTAEEEEQLLRYLAFLRSRRSSS